MFEEIIAATAGPDGPVKSTISTIADGINPSATMNLVMTDWEDRTGGSLAFQQRLEPGLGGVIGVALSPSPRTGVWRLQPRATRRPRWPSPTWTCPSCWQSTIKATSCAGRARHCLSDQRCNGSLQEAWIGGVSTRRVDDLVQAMGLSGISKSAVSKLVPRTSTNGSASS